MLLRIQIKTAIQGTRMKQGAAECVRRCPCKANEESETLYIATSWAGRTRFAPCMYPRAEKCETTSHGCLPRMGPKNSSEEGTHGGLPRCGPPCGIAPHQNAHGAATPCAAQPDRPFAPWDLDPVKEHGSPDAFLVKPRTAD